MTCTHKRNKDFRMTNPMHLHANRNKNYKSENMKKLLEITGFILIGK